MIPAGFDVTLKFLTGFTEAEAFAYSLDYGLGRPRAN